MIRRIRPHDLRYDCGGRCLVPPRTQADRGGILVVLDDDEGQFRTVPPTVELQDET
ncbi:hypothetical protein B296_00048087, partial [Ensete ventricosum]